MNKQEEDLRDGDLLNIIIAGAGREGQHSSIKQFHKQMSRQDRELYK